MGAKAARGFSVFCRQDFVGADYGLLDCSTQTPLPDYYTSKMWTRLMGPDVLAATVAGPRTVRAYAHCSALAPRRGGAPAGAGRAGSAGSRDLALLLLNLDGGPVDVRVPAAAPSAGARGSVPRTEWHFTAGAGGLGGPGIRLGGVALEWAPGQELPAMPGASVPSETAVRMAPQSIVFARVPGAAPAGLCS